METLELWHGKRHYKSMRRSSLLRSIAVISTLALVAPHPAVASLNGSVDYSNPRIVPFLTSMTTDAPAGSGFLYSSRIVLTAGHLAYGFDQSGNIVPLVRENYVGLPNTKITATTPRMKVIKQFTAKTYRSTPTGALDDFAVFVLEKDLINAEPVPLLTPEIEKELVASKAQVRLHGFGIFEDACKSGENPPCKLTDFNPSREPRAISANIYPMESFQNLVGYTQPQFANELLFFHQGKESMCNGDSGGSLTTTYKGALLYVANIGTAQGIYACGQGRYDGKGGINYSAPVYRHLDIIREAEAFVAAQIAEEKKSGAVQPTSSPSAPALSQAKKKTITCVKGKAIKKVTDFNPKCPAGYKKK